MRTRRNHLSIVPLLVLVLISSACSDDDPAAGGVAPTTLTTAVAPALTTVAPTTTTMVAATTTTTTTEPSIPDLLSVVVPLSVGIPVVSETTAWSLSGLGGRVQRIDATPTGLMVTATELGPWAAGLAVGEGAAWVTHPDARTVTRIDEATGEITTIAMETKPGAVAVGFGSVWVANSEDGGVTRLDPTGTISGVITTGEGPSTILVSTDAVWVSNQYGDDGTVTRIDPATNQTTDIYVGPKPFSLSVGYGAIWVVLVGFPDDTTIMRIDEATLEATEIYVGLNPGGVVPAPDGVWVVGGTGSSVIQTSVLIRLDPVTFAITPIDLQGWDIRGLSSAADAMWVIANADGRRSALRIFPDGRLEEVDDLPDNLAFITAGDGAVWLMSSDRKVIRVSVQSDS